MLRPLLFQHPRFIKRGVALAGICRHPVTQSKRIFSSEQLPNHPQDDHPSYHIDQLKELRRLSGAPLKECKQALVWCNGEVNDAMDWLRIRGKSVAQQKASQLAEHGFIGLFNDLQSASLVEVNCVTDYAGNTMEFQNAVLNIGNTIQKSNDDHIFSNWHLNTEKISDEVLIMAFSEDTKSGTHEQTIGEALTDIVGSIRENLVFRRAYKMTVSENGIIGCYLHGRKTNNLGLKGALIGLETDTKINNLDKTQKDQLISLGNDIATHVVATYPQPKFIHRHELAENTIEKEKELLINTILEKDGDSLDTEILNKKIEGRMKKYFKDNILMDQPFCLDDDDKLTVEKLLHNKSKEIGCPNIEVSHMVVFDLGQVIHDHY